MLMQFTSICSSVDQNADTVRLWLAFEPDKLGQLAFYRKTFSQSLCDRHQLCPKCALWATETGAERRGVQGSKPEMYRGPDHWLSRVLLMQ